MENEEHPQTYNPDVLSCLANLSNDEIFTPPVVANQMLDMLPESIWHDSKARFLDPACKSGVFLREIAKRLIVGLKDEMPDLSERVNHIFSQQLFGISITELTSLLSRRSVYCSKEANGKYSVCSKFDDEQGHIYFPKAKHVWQNGTCIYCGASQSVYDRDDSLESHAYPFIHNVTPKDIVDMNFDVIIGNPPYQLGDGGGRDSAAIPLYNLFVERAINLSPKYLCMIIPARWYTGGRGLDSFRDKILHDDRISIIHDFPETNDCFPGLNVRGGICYFLWDSTHHGICNVINHIKGTSILGKRSLLEMNSNVFIRYNQSISILRKVQNFREKKLSIYVSSSKPFGLRSNFDEFKMTETPKCKIKLYRFGNNGYVSESQIINNRQLIGRYKVLVSKASPGGDEYPHMIVSQPIISEPNSVCTETYLVIKDFDTRQQAENLVSYIKTRFFRFMMSLIKNTQNISKASYAFVPIQDFSESWTDEKLYKKYGLTEEEIAFIESLIRPME
ncbi:MAG: Eco57I restriction-modification methylase domain-containing protein [Paludibacteraceae bacterium]|nr:Eco57I restriction-modification methylase domain-containing protein [Paludibacteraceae bacterium]